MEAKAICCFVGVLLPNHIHWHLFELLVVGSYHNIWELFLGVCCISTVLSSEMSYLLMGSSPMVKLILKEMLVWWQCLVERVVGSSLILGMIVVVFGSVELEGLYLYGIRFHSLCWDFSIKGDLWLTCVMFVAVKYEALFWCSFDKLKKVFIMLFLCLSIDA